MNLSFNICDLKDLDILLKISRDTFIAAFEKDNNPEDFQNYIDTAFNKETLKTELINPNSSFYLVFLKEMLVGYFKLNEKDAQNERFQTDNMELERIYVLNTFQGKEIGKQMLLKVIDIAKSKNLSFLWLGVWQENTNAVRFYERHNFNIFDEHPYYIGADKQMDWLMRLELSQV